MQRAALVLAQIVSDVVSIVGFAFCKPPQAVRAVNVKGAKVFVADSTIFLNPIDLML